ncbi:hypothetical protein L204_104426 [Cryptococcus depauperatus]|nr:kinetochore protein NDC80 [Cryptococcus depauperatus CBS 7855]
METQRRHADQAASGRSSAAAPSSIMKKTNRLGPARQSMAPQPLHSRPSNLPDMQELGQSSNSASVSRRSLMPNRGYEPRESMMSAGRGDAGIYGRSSQSVGKVPGSVRRNSVFSSNGQGRASLAAGLYSAPYKDPRPIRDKTFQTNCMRNINHYLVATRYPSPITPKTFTSPTAKEFQSIFRFLVNDFIDQSLAWGKKFEDDTLTILKDLKYPGMDSVSKTALTAPGAPQSWPNLLAMLNWLVDLCKSLGNWDDPECISDPLKIPASELPVEYPNYEHRLLWDFSAKTYTQWFEGEVEEFTEAERELDQAYERMASSVTDEIQKLETEIQKRLVEVQRLNAQEPPLKRLEDEYVQLMSDNNKFFAFLNLHRQKEEKIRQRIAKVKEVVGHQEQELKTHQANLVQIEKNVAEQNLSPDEVTRMTHEKDNLTRSLDDLRGKIAEASQFAYDQEMMVTKSMDRLETFLADYNALAHQIGLVDSSTGVPLSFNDINYIIDVDLGAEDVDRVKAIGTEMRSTLWQALQTCRETFRQEALGFSNSLITLDDEFDKLSQTVERQKEEAGSVEARIKNVNQQAEDTHKQSTAEGTDTSKIITQLETEVTNMLAASQQGVLSTRSHLESTRIAFKELRHKTSLLQDYVVAQIGEHIDAVIKTKEHAANSLRSIRALAETQ